MNSVQKNFLYNVAYQILLVLLPLVTAPYISRMLGPTAVGIYSYTNSVANYFLLTATLGIANYGNRSIAAAREDKETLNRTFSSLFCLQAIIFCIGLIAYAFYLFAFVKDNRLVAALQMLYIFSGLLDISWLYFGLEKFKITVTRNIAVKILTVVMVFVLVQEPGDLWKYTLIMVSGNVLSQAYLWFCLKKHAVIVRVKAKEIFCHIKPVLMLFIPVLAYSIYKIMDKIMLGNMSTYEQVGFYNSAEKIINIPMGVITALGTVMLPRMSNSLAKGDAGVVARSIRISTKFVTIVASAIAFGLIGISNGVVPIFFGEGYEPCIRIIQLLSVTVFFVSWANVVRTQYLIPNHYDKIYIISTFVGAVLNFVVNLLLIPTLHATGAAIGTIVAEFSVMITQFVAIRRKMPVYKYIREYVPVLLIGLIMMFAVRYIGVALSSGVISLALQVVGGGVLFCVCVIIFLKIKKDEIWDQLVVIFKNKRQKNTTGKRNK